MPKAAKRAKKVAKAFDINRIFVDELPFPIEEIGGYPRDYDTILTEDADSPDADIFSPDIVHDEETQKKLADTLSWVDYRINPEKTETHKEKLRFVEDFAIRGISQTGGKIIGSGRVKPLYLDFRASMKDMFRSRRKRTARRMFASMIVGGIIGALFIPFVGWGLAAAGIVTLAALEGAGIVALVGGGLAMSVAGIYIGKKLALKRIGSKKHTKYYAKERAMLSSRYLDAIRKKFGIKGDLANLMSAFLHNREQSVQNNTIKKTYNKLREEALEKPTRQGMEMFVRFLLKEYEILTEEKLNDSSQDNSARDQEIQALEVILKGLQQANNIGKEHRKEIHIRLELTNKKLQQLRAPVVEVNQSKAAQDVTTTSFPMPSRQSAPRPLKFTRTPSKQRSAPALNTHHACRNVFKVRKKGVKSPRLDSVEHALHALSQSEQQALQLEATTRQYNHCLSRDEVEVSIKLDATKPSYSGYIFDAPSMDGQLVYAVKNDIPPSDEDRVIIAMCQLAVLNATKDTPTQGHTPEQLIIDLSQSPLHKSALIEKTLRAEIEKHRATFIKQEIPVPIIEKTQPLKRVRPTISTPRPSFSS